MTKEKLEQLARIRKSQNRVVMSEFIRIGMSDLYDYDPGVRATLREIAFLQVNDEAASVPADSPFKDDYTGWCYASQGYLAERVGKSESQVQRDIKKFELDGVIAVRSWRDGKGYEHNEYHVIESVVQDHQRKDDEPRKPKKTKRDYLNYENKGAFKKGQDDRRQGKSHAASDAEPPSMARNSHAASHAVPPSIPRSARAASDAEPLRAMRAEGVDLGGCSLEGFDVSKIYEDEKGASAVPPAAATGLGSVDVVEQQHTPKGSSGFKLGDQPLILKDSGVEVLGAEARKRQQQNQNQDQNQKPVIVKGEKKPLPNWKCYEELFRGRVDKHGNWLGGRLPKCRRCAATLQPEEHHDCPGYLEGGESHLGEYVYHPIAPKGTALHDPEDRLARREASYDDWDDDHYDRTTEGNIDRDPDAEESGVVMGVEEAE